MKLTRAVNCYSSGKVACDVCRESYSGSRLIYHCPRGKITDHPGGADMCRTCAARHASSGNNSDVDLLTLFSAIGTDPQKAKEELMCHCGAALKLAKAANCYNGQNVYCDLCNREIPQNENAHHCPNLKNQAHGGGYDLCEYCGDNRSVAERVTAVLRQHLEGYRKAHSQQKQQIARLQQMNDSLVEEQKENQIKIQQLEKEVAELKMNNIDTSKYMEWDWEEVLIWILSLENGRYKKYEAVLRKSLAEEGMKGQYLSNVDVADVKGWGIMNFLDKKSLAKHIEDLVEQNSGASVAQAAAAFSPGAPNETDEGGATALLQ